MDTSEITYRQVGRDEMYRIWHSIPSHIRFIYVHKGDGSVVVRSGILPIREGALYMIGDSARHYTLPEHTDIYERSKLLVKTSRLFAVEELRAAFAGYDAMMAVLPEAAQKECEDIFLRLSLLDEDTPMRETLSTSAAMRLCALICLYRFANLPAPAGYISCVLDHINRSISDTLTLDSICSAVGVSKYYLCHRFKEQMGITVMEYVHRTRIELAKELLSEDHSLTVSEIAEKCGFTNLSFFCKTFKRITGLSPKLYRNI